MATTTAIPANFMDLFKKPAFASFATLNPDGSPQVTPVWVDYDGKHLLVTKRGLPGGFDWVELPVGR